MRLLRKNTAVIVTVGPFYDKTDGVTIETALTITNERITLTADTDDGSAPTNILDNVTGATSATSNDLNYITGNDAGMMQLELAAADTNRLGRMMLSITDAANHVPVFHEFMVVNSALYDAFFATSGGAIPNAVAGAAGGVFIAGTNAATIVTTSFTSTFTGNLTGSVASVTGAVGSVTGNVGGNVTGSVGSVATNGITAASLAADVATELQSGLATAAALSTAQADLDDIQTRVPAALVGGRMDSSTGAMAANVMTAAAAAADLTTELQAGLATSAALTSVAGDVTTILADTNDIQTRLPAALVSGRMDASTGAMAANVLTAAATAADFGAEVADAVWDEVLSGHVGAGSAGEALSAAGTAGDPWTTALPGAYGAGTAGKIVGDNVNATISSRATPAQVNTEADTAIADAALATAANLSTVAGYLDTEVAAIKTKTDFLPSATAGAAGGLFIAGSNAATTVNFTGSITGNLSGTVGSVTGAVGSVTGAVGSVTGLTAADVGSIKAKTDSLTFTVANVLDANVQRINDVTITGNGGVGTEFGV